MNEVACIETTFLTHNKVLALEFVGAVIAAKNQKFRSISLYLSATLRVQPLKSYRFVLVEKWFLVESAPRASIGLRVARLTWILEWRIQPASLLDPNYYGFDALATPKLALKHPLDAQCFATPKEKAVVKC